MGGKELPTARAEYFKKFGSRTPENRPESHSYGECKKIFVVFLDRRDIKHVYMMKRKEK
jgi:hypothetical protein